MFLGESMLIMTLKKKKGGWLLLRGHPWDGLSCLHFNLAFICVLSSRDSCHKAESPSSGLCLDKVNKWSGTLAGRVGMSKVEGSELQATKLGLRTPYAQFPPLFDYWLAVCSRKWTNNPGTSPLKSVVLEIWRWTHKHSNSVTFDVQPSTFFAGQPRFNWNRMQLKRGRLEGESCRVGEVLSCLWHLNGRKKGSLSLLLEKSSDFSCAICLFFHGGRKLSGKRFPSQTLKWLPRRSK